MIRLVAVKVNAIVGAAMMNEMTAAGGIRLIGIGISCMLALKKISGGRLPFGAGHGTGMDY